MNKWEELLKEFWVSEFAPDEFSLREAMIVKEFVSFLQSKEAAQQGAQRTGLYCRCNPEVAPLFEGLQICAACGLPRR